MPRQREDGILQEMPHLQRSRGCGGKMKNNETICYMHGEIQTFIESIVSNAQDCEVMLKNAVDAGQRMEDAIHDRNKKIELLEKEIKNLNKEIKKLTKDNEKMTKQIEMIKPEVVVTLGNVPLKALVSDNEAKIGNYHGRPVRKNNIII